jgi:predicted nucleic acid-binding protein
VLSWAAIRVLGVWHQDRAEEELPPICRDPEDDFVIALYQDSDAAILVSRDNDLLDPDLSRRLRL